MGAGGADFGRAAGGEQGKPGNLAQVEKYSTGKVVGRLEDARAAMAELAAANETADLYRRGFRLYERVRPSVPQAVALLRFVRAQGERAGQRSPCQGGSRCGSRLVVNIGGSVWCDYFLRVTTSRLDWP